MRFILIAASILNFAFSLQAFSDPPAAPYASVENDPCISVIRSVVDQVQTSSKGMYKARSVTLISATEERDYDLRFDGLSGRYDLVLDNDASNRCFLIQQKYVF
jgi:hypothetical protein